jgi:hypothetical protein
VAPQNDVASLKADVTRLLAGLAAAHAEAAENVAVLVELDKVKSRMEAARDTLRVPPNTNLPGPTLWRCLSHTSLAAFKSRV